MDNESIGRALKQLRENKNFTREEVVTRLTNLERKRVVTTVRKWEMNGSIKLDDAYFYVTRVLGYSWEEFEAEVEHQEKLARRRPRKPRPPKDSAGGAAAAPGDNPDQPA